MQTQTINGFRLSPQQKRLWSLATASPIFHAQCTLLIEGELDGARLKSSLERIIDRHEILRSTYNRLHGMKIPMRVVCENGRLDWSEFDFTRENSDQMERVAAEVREQSRAPFDLQSGPLVRASLFALDDRRHLFSVTLPSMCADARTLLNILQEIATIYGRQAEPSIASEEPLQYTQFSEWVHELIDSEEGETAAKFWKKIDLSAVASFGLPFENIGLLDAQYDVDSVTLQVDPGLFHKIQGVAESHSVLTETFLMSCWFALLSRLTGEENITVGYVCDGRGYDVLEKALGLFASCVPLQASVERNAKFSDLLPLMQQSARESDKWQAGFDWNRNRESDGESGYYAVGFEYIEGEGKLDAPAERFTLQQITSRSDRFKLKLNCFNLSYGLSLSLEFDSRCLQPDDVLGLANHLLELLASASASPRLPVIDLHIVPAEDLIAQQQMTERARRGYAFTPVHQLIERQAAINAERVAVVSGDESITYAELNARANQVARFLRGRGVGGEQVVAVMMGRGAGMIAGMLGVMKAGAAYLPMDGKQPPGRQAYMLEDAGVRYLLVDDRMSGRAPAGRWEVVNVEGEQVARQGEEDLGVEVVSDRSLAYVIYTSGTTGEAKGVGVEHRQLSNYVEAVSERLGMRGGESFAVVSTLSADLCNTGIYPTLAGGGRLHVIGEEVATDGERLWEEVEREGIEMMKIVPSHLKAVMGVGRAGRGLKKVVVGGEASSWEMVEKVKGEGWAEEVYNHYGPTETTVGVTCWRVEGGRESGRVAIGEMLGNVKVYVMDERGRRVGVGMSGEIHIGGEAVSRGYIGKEAETAERYLPDAYSGEAGARMYRTGDRGRIRGDGRVEFLGRVDQQIKLRGYRIELGEINIRLKQYPGLRDAVTVLKKDIWGEDILVAYYVSRKAIDQAELRKFLSDFLAEEITPNLFMHLHKLPLTINGKVNLAALPTVEQARQQAQQQQFVPPRTPVEEELAKIWGELLGFDRIGAHDNFFHLGGHSLLATRLIIRARVAFQVDIPVRAIFDSPTVAEMAVTITQLHIEQSGDEEILRILQEVQGLATPDHSNLS